VIRHVIAPEHCASEKAGILQGADIRPAGHVLAPCRFLSLMLSIMAATQTSLAY
jgi:hypothetical protein